MRYWIFAVLALGGLMVGCSKETKPPPPDVETETPDLDISGGSLVEPGELTTAPETDEPATVEPGKSAEGEKDKKADESGADTNPAKKDDTKKDE